MTARKHDEHEEGAHRATYRAAHPETDDAGRELERHPEKQPASTASDAPPKARRGKQFKPGDVVKVVSAGHAAKGKRCRVQGYVTKDDRELVSCVSEDSRHAFDAEEGELKPVQEPNQPPLPGAAKVPGR